MGQSKAYAIYNAELACHKKRKSVVVGSKIKRTMLEALNNEIASLYRMAEESKKKIMLLEFDLETAKKHHQDILKNIDFKANQRNHALELERGTK